MKKLQSQQVLRNGIALLMLLASPFVWASPGAHGPNGEHLDTPAAAASSNTNPRFEAKTEAFELVGALTGSELSILIDRYATNEPVLGATVEVESSGVKAIAKFTADVGSYVVADTPLLKRLSEPGTHPLVITVLAGQETDLVDARLVVSHPAADAVSDDHGHSHGPGLAAHAHDMNPRTKWFAGLALLGLTVMAVVLLRRRGRAWGADQGGQA
jgi:hypothetical protein